MRCSTARKRAAAHSIASHPFYYSSNLHPDAMHAMVTDTHTHTEQTTPHLLTLRAPQLTRLRFTTSIQVFFFLPLQQAWLQDLSLLQAKNVFLFINKSCLVQTRFRKQEQATTCIVVLYYLCRANLKL